jgi:hypothetical protein
MLSPEPIRRLCQILYGLCKARTALRPHSGPHPRPTARPLFHGASSRRQLFGGPFRDPLEPCASAHGESACKPGSVEGNHSSGIHVAVNLKRPTRKRTRIGAALSRLRLSRR